MLALVGCASLTEGQGPLLDVLETAHAMEDRTLFQRLPQAQRAAWEVY